MKKKPYEIIGHGTRNPAKLTRHPDAETPIGQDELLALTESVRERGLIDPILVNDKDQVLDGCSRLEAALQAGLDEVPVTVVHCEDVRALASDSLIGRMRSKSQRVLAWVLKQAADATVAWDIRRQVPVQDSAKPTAVADSAKKHYPDLKPAEVVRLLDTYTPSAIAAKLSLSEDYAASALQLVACIRLKLKVSTDATGKTRYTAMTSSKADQAYLEQLHQAMDNILRGDAQVTRWRAGLAGATATKDQRKAETNVPKVFMQASTSLVKTVFPSWAKLTAEERGDITENLRTGFAKSCPPDLARELIDVLETVVAEQAQG